MLCTPGHVDFDFQKPLFHSTLHKGVLAESFSVFDQAHYCCLDIGRSLEIETDHTVVYPLQKAAPVGEILKGRVTAVAVFLACIMDISP